MLLVCNVIVFIHHFMRHNLLWHTILLDTFIFVLTTNYKNVYKINTYFVE